MAAMRPGALAAKVRGARRAPDPAARVPLLPVVAVRPAAVVWWGPGVTQRPLAAPAVGQGAAPALEWRERTAAAAAAAPAPTAQAVAVAVPAPRVEPRELRAWAGM